jgi:hypothetical protein
MVLDQRRKDGNKNAFCPCVKQEKKKDEEKPKCLKVR